MSEENKVASALDASREQVKAQAAHMQARAKAEKKAKDAAEKSTNKKGWTIAPGKSLATKRGALSPGAVVTVHDLIQVKSSDDKAFAELRLQELHEKGYLLLDGRALELAEVKPQQDKVDKSDKSGAKRREI